jgi:hypothetical protein
VTEAQKHPDELDPQSGLDLQALFHRLNNQLGVLLAHAELLETKTADDANRVRAAQIVSSTLAAMGTVREIRQRTDSGELIPSNSASTKAG